MKVEKEVISAHHFSSYAQFYLFLTFELNKLKNNQMTWVNTRVIQKKKGVRESHFFYDCIPVWNYNVRIIPNLSDVRRPSYTNTTAYMIYIINGDSRVSGNKFLEIYGSAKIN